MTDRFVASNLDLSTLPSPEVIKGVNYETILAERLARFKALWPDFDMESLETDPAKVLQEVDAYREMLDKAAINDSARAVMVAFATGANLDNLAAFYGVVRLVISPAANGVAAVYETDADLRRRVQLAPEQLPYAGMTGGGYRALALRVAPTLKDVSAVKRSGGRIDVVLLSRTGNGTVDSGVVSAVASVFRDDEATQLTDIVSVRAADIVSYTISLKLRIPLGPDHAAVRTAAQTAIRAYCDARHRVGLAVYATGIIAAAMVGGVEQVVPVAPIVDVLPGQFGAAYCTAITVTSEVVE